MSIREWLALAALSLALPAAVGAPPSDVALARLDGFAQGMTAAQQFSGVVLVAHEGKPAFLQAYGLRDQKGEEPNTVDTRFNLASAGKMFTAVAVLQQIAAGKLTLDTRVGEVLKDYPNREFAEKVTVRHLLTHTAGAGDIALFDAANAANRKRARTVEQMVALHADRAPAFAPGSSQSYGNFGHVVLGRMVEVVSGTLFEDYVRTAIFVPAGMSDTAFVDCEEINANTAVGYATVDEMLVRNCATLPARGFPAGGQVSTAKDMLKFIEALRAGTLVPKALFEDATRTHHEFMGLGFFATGYGPGVPESEFRWGHGGGADGICTDVRTHPSTGETLIVLANVDPPRCHAVANALHDYKN